MSDPEYVKILVRFEKGEIEALDKAVGEYAPGLDPSRTSAIREAVRRYTRQLLSEAKPASPTPPTPEQEGEA